MKITSLRFLIPVFLIHLIALPSLLYQYMIHFEAPVWEALGQSILGQLENRIAIHQLTGQPGVQQVQKSVDEFSESYRFMSLNVYDASGELRASHGPIMKNLRDENRTEMKVVPQGYVLELTHMVENSPRCYQCHSSNKQRIGTIRASLNVTEIAVKLGAERKNAVAVVFLTLFFVFSLIYVVHYFFVIKPVNTISTSLKKITQGDLTVRVPVTRKDDLGVISSGINEMVDSLFIARKQLEEEHQQRMSRAEQLASVGEIAAGLAHEVKNPIAGICSALEVLVSETEVSAAHREVLVQMIDEGHRIAEIINRLLDYARPKPAEPDWWDISVITSEIQTIFAPRCQQHRVRFSIQQDQSIGRMFVDANEVKQVLMNILLNALDAVGTGGNIELKVTQQKDDVTFLIRDDGPGMDSTTREKIFQPFFTTKSSGTGLGLPIVLRCVKEMGGAVRVESKIGQGTTFAVSLPRECYRETARN